MGYKKEILDKEATRNLRYQKKRENISRVNPFREGHIVLLKESVGEALRGRQHRQVDESTIR